MLYTVGRVAPLRVSYRTHTYTHTPHTHIHTTRIHTHIHTAHVHIHITRTYSARIVSYHTLPGVHIYYVLSCNTRDVHTCSAQTYVHLRSTAAAIVPGRIPKVSYTFTTSGQTSRIGSRSQTPMG